jgi:hypothetical protein
MHSEQGNVWLNARHAFLPFYGVVGVGWGPKVTRGKVVTQHATIICFSRKAKVCLNKHP